MYRFNVSTYAKPLLILLAALLLASATSAQVNNCCSIDRQCSTNDEWVSGYYAFRNGQCAAPAESQQQAHQARQDQGPSPSNNCCFSNWQCSTNEDWTSGYFAFQQDHCFSQSHWEEQVRKQRGLSNPKPNGWGGWCPPDCVSSPTSVEEYEPGKFRYTYESGDQLETWHHTWDEFCELVENEHPTCTPGYSNSNPVRIETTKA